LLDSGKKFVRSRRLRQNALHSQRAIGCRIARVKLRTVDDDSAIECNAPHSLDEFQARQRRHLMVRNEHIKRIGLSRYPLECSQSVLCLLDAVSAALKREFQQHCHLLVILGA